jgi:hypothetical protein
MEQIAQMETAIQNVELLYNLTMIDIDYNHKCVTRHEEKERKCRESGLYRTFYTSVQKANLPTLDSIVSQYEDKIIPIAKPTKGGDIYDYAKHLHTYYLDLKNQIVILIDYKAKLKNLADSYQDIYRKRIKSYMYCVMYDM